MGFSFVKRFQKGILFLGIPLTWGVLFRCVCFPPIFRADEAELWRVLLAAKSSRMLLLPFTSFPCFCVACQGSGSCSAQRGLGIPSLKSQNRCGRFNKPWRRNKRALKLFTGTMEHSFKNTKLIILAGSWRSRNEIPVSLENVIIARSITIACLSCASLAGVLSWAICVAIFMDNVRTSTINPISRVYSSCQNSLWSETWQ